MHRINDLALAYYSQVHSKKNASIFHNEINIQLSNTYLANAMLVTTLSTLLLQVREGILLVTEISGFGPILQSSAAIVAKHTRNRGKCERSRLMSTITVWRLVADLVYIRRSTTGLSLSSPCFFLSVPFWASHHVFFWEKRLHSFDILQSQKVPTFHIKNERKTVCV